VCKICTTALQLVRRYGETLCKDNRGVAKEGLFKKPVRLVLEVTPPHTGLQSLANKTTGSTFSSMDAV
jgi:hypothetical protein